MEQLNYVKNLRQRKLVPVPPTAEMGRKLEQVNRLNDEPTQQIDNNDNNDNNDDDGIKHKTIIASNYTLMERTLIFMIFIASLATRLFEINASPIVIWDEAHFGKFANWYIKRKFYFDVHPPLGKMLIAFTAWIFNYDGNFAFESGSTYSDKVPIKQMRIMSAIFGSLVPPLIYGTCRNIHLRSDTALLVACLIIFDNAILTISKFVLLDSILLTFTSLSMFCITQARSIHGTPFSKQWHRWMFATGISLGCVSSIKWVGFFTVASVGVITITDLWHLLRNIRVSYLRQETRVVSPQRGETSPFDYGRHWLFRAIYLIIIPILVYMGIFAIHFMILINSGPGDTQMSSLFQMSLKGSPIVANQSLSFITIGSIITLRNQGFGAGLLHSHHQKYPEGSKQAQVTLYHHRDHNNFWVVQPPWSYYNKMNTQEKIIKNGYIIRLLHNATQHNLHSHAIPAPISVFDNEVSTYGNTTIGDDKDHWIIEINKKFISNLNKTKIYTLTTTIQLKHAVLGCYLSGTTERLPEWGFGQGQVVCTMNKYAKSSFWNIEQHINYDEENYDVDLDPSSFSLGRNTSSQYQRPSFIHNFLELNMAMWHGNNALKPKLGKRDLLISKPWQWAFLNVGVRLCNWKDETLKFYLIGNPIVWWITSSSILFFIGHSFILSVKSQIRGYSCQNDNYYIFTGLLLVTIWSLHYFPFWIMGRVTYLHHYFPALIVSTLCFGWVYNRLTMNLTNAKRFFLSFISILILFATFIFFSPLSYGFKGPASVMSNRTWRNGWNIYQ